MSKSDVESLNEMFPGAARVEEYRDGVGPPTGLGVATAERDEQQVPESPGNESADIAGAAGEDAAGDRSAAHDDAATSGPADPAGSDVPVEVAGPREGRVVGSEVALSDPGEVVLETALEGRDAATFAAAPTGWTRRLLKLVGLGSSPSEDERFEPDYERIIRQSTWTRSMNVTVAQRAGGDGVTPTALMLGNTFAAVRGAHVGVIEATLAPGALARVAEGSPRRGLGELLSASSGVASTSSVAGYSAPQTSHAAVFGSVSSRELLSAEDAVRVREVLDPFHQLTVTDTDHTLESSAARAVIGTADAVVIPCVRQPQSLWDAVLTFQEVQRQRPDLVGSPEDAPALPRITIVVGSDGPGEDPQLAGSAAAWLTAQLPAAAVMVHGVPFEPAMKSGREISHADCAVASQRAWKRVAAALVTCLLDAPEESRTQLWRTTQEPDSSATGGGSPTRSSTDSAAESTHTHETAGSSEGVSA